MTYPRWKFHKTHAPKVIHSAFEEHPEWHDSPPEAWKSEEDAPEKPVEPVPHEPADADAPGLQADEDLTHAADVPLPKKAKAVVPPVKEKKPFVTGNSLIT